MKTKNAWKDGIPRKKNDTEGPTQRQDEGKGRGRGRDRPSVPLSGCTGVPGGWQGSEGGPETRTDAQPNSRREKGD